MSCKRGQISFRTVRIKVWLCQNLDPVTQKLHTHKKRAENKFNSAHLINCFFKSGYSNPKHTHLDCQLAREAGRFLFLSLLARPFLNFLLKVSFSPHFSFLYKEKRDYRASTHFVIPVQLDIRRRTEENMKTSRIATYSLMLYFPK